MYDLKVLLPQFEIEMPTCMYPMKNVTSATTEGPVEAISNGYCSREPTTPHASNASSAALDEHSALKRKCALDLDVLGSQIQQILKESTEVSAVIKRQEVVMQQLEELKEQLSTIRASLNVCQKSVKHTAQNISLPNGGLREEPLHDIVINGHPNFIPYALLALKTAWKDLFNIEVKTFTHSTMPDIGEAAREFEKNLAAVAVDETKPKVNVTLIWKNCEHTEMISSPTMYVPIYGEVNIIRYLGRVGPAEYRYEDSPLCNEIDAVLDICYQLLRCTTPASIKEMISALDARLQKQQYFGGSKMSVADIGVHSSFKRMPTITDKNLTPALSQWRKRTQQVANL